MAQSFPEIPDCPEDETLLRERWSERERRETQKQNRTPQIGPMTEDHFSVVGDPACNPNQRQSQENEMQGDYAQSTYIHAFSHLTFATARRQMEIMNSVDAVIRFRWLLVTLGVFLLILILLPALRSRRERWKKRLDRVCERDFGKILGLLAGAFIVLGWLSKNLQLVSLRLNGQDFWLFEDMIRQMQEGGFFLTRFAPQAIGFVQHGAVHPTFSWILTVPFAWVLGATQAALLFGPLVFALAAVVLAHLARPRVGATAALTLAAAFLASTQVGKVLNYDVHFESAYPLFLLLWAWGMGFGDQKVRIFPLILGVILGMGVKEDSFLVFFPVIAWSCLALRDSQRKHALLSAVLAVIILGFQFYSIKQWTQGAWGPHQWEGASVFIPAGADLVQGKHWSSPGQAQDIASSLLAAHGGIFGTAKTLLRFLISRPWLSLLIFAPWLALRLPFWIWILPLAGAYSLLQRAATLNIYYSAPFLGIFWLSVVFFSPRKGVIYILLATLLLGSSSLEFRIPSAETQALKQEAGQLAKCLSAGSGRSGPGLVQSSLLQFVAREKVFTDRVPKELNQISFALFSPLHGTFELPSTVAEEFYRRLRSDASWAELDDQCRKIRKNGTREKRVVLMISDSRPEAR